MVLNPGGLIALAPLSNLETLLGAQLLGATIIRVRGVVSAAIVGDSTGQAYAAARMAMRITDHADVASQDYAIGAMYGNQAHADWFLFEPFMLDNGGVSVLDEEVDTTSASEIRRIDVKARRKVDELDQTVELVVGSPAPDATQPPFSTVGMRLRWDLSILVMLA